MLFVYMYNLSGLAGFMHVSFSRVKTEHRGIARNLLMGHKKGVFGMVGVWGLM